ncbi:MAG: DUF4126 family protein [Candidatus Velthaea sp.]
MILVLIASLGLGIVSGLRTFLAPAALYVARGGVAGYVLGVVALGELIGDVLPKTPSRTILPQLVARLVSGAFVGWMLCTFLGAPPIAGATLGLAGALIGTYGGAAVRASLIDRIGAVPAALAEDAIGIIAAVTLISALPSFRIG